MAKIFKCPSCHSDLALSWDHEKLGPVVDLVEPAPDPNPKLRSDDDLLAEFFSDGKKPADEKAE